MSTVELTNFRKLWEVLKLGENVYSAFNEQRWAEVGLIDPSVT